MRKAGIKFANLAINNGSVVVYYHRETTMRLPTGVNISKKKAKNGKYVDWDSKRQTLSADVDNFTTNHEIIQKALKNANEILDENAKNGIFLTGNELQELILKQRDEKALVRSALMLDMYRQFHEDKRGNLLVNGNILSLKDYTSFLNVIIDYEMVHGERIKIASVDYNFCTKLHNWLKLQCPQKVKTPNGDHYLKTHGKLKPKTLRKRFDTLKEFFKFLQLNKFVDSYEFLKEFVRKNISNVKNEKVTLTVDEVFKIYDYHFDALHLNKIKHLFTFACLTGMRWGDLVGFDARFIQNIDTAPVYKRKAQKTANSSGIILELPLCPTAMEILRANGMSLKPLMLSNVKANLYLKDALKLTGYFDQITNLVDKDTGEYLRRYEAITMHKGRDSFITNLVNVTPLSELMKYTGHSKITTLQQYIDVNRSVSHKFVNEAFKR